MKINDIPLTSEKAGRRMLLSAALSALGSIAAVPAAQSQTTAVDNVGLLNFSLNINYLFSQYLGYGLYGRPTPVEETRGAGINPPAGGVVSGGRTLTINDRVSDLTLRVIEDRSRAQIRTLRAILFSNLVQQPPIDISPATFTRLMQAAGVTEADSIFDPYASPDNFLLGAYVIGDVAVSVERNIATRITDELTRNAAMTLMSARAASAGAIRGLLHRRGLTIPSVFAIADAISAQRDRYDGATVLDAGLSPVTIAGSRVSRIVPGNADALVAARSPGQVLNILYMSNAAVSRGGFFPEGVNGSIRTSAAN